MPGPANGRPNTDPIAARSPFLVAFFNRIFARSVKRAFHGVRLARGTRPAPPCSRSIVIYANHASWWDPAIFAVLSARLFPSRRAYGPIDEAALAQYRFMRRIGLFGVRPDSRVGASDFLRIGRRILGDPRSLLIVTPEGRFTDVRVRPVRFQRGLAHLLAHEPETIALPLALEYPFWNEKCPEVLCRFGTPEPARALGTSADEIHEALQGRLTDVMDALAGDVQGRDADRFDMVLGGATGVGGVYDVWRRGRAWASGRAFRPAHGHLVDQRTTRR